MTREQMTATLILLGWVPVQDITVGLSIGFSRVDLMHPATCRHAYAVRKHYKASRNKTAWSGAPTSRYAPADWEQLTDDALAGYFHLVHLLGDDEEGHYES